MQLTGEILSVDSRNMAESTTADKASGATVLDVTDASSFPVDGGMVVIEGVPVSYLSADYDANQITLEVPLTAALPAESIVEVYPPTPERTALVDLGDDGEAAPVVVPHFLAVLIDDGVRTPDQQETVTVERREDGTLAILDVTNRPAVLTTAALDAVQTTDGVPPTSSPAPTVLGGIGAIAVRWTPLTNNDPVRYEVHLSTDPGFTPGPGTLGVDTTGFSATLRTMPDGSPLVYDVTYWVRVVAYDDDGRADPSLAQSGQLMRVTSADIAANYVYAGTLSATQITSGTIQSDVLLSGSIKTAPSGARVELGAFGLIEYDSNGNPSVLLGSDGQSVFQGQVQATTLTVTGGMSLRGTANEVSRSASLTLAQGSTASSNSPSVVVDWESFLFQEDGTANGTFLSKTPLSLTRVGSTWVVNYSDGITRVFSASGAYQGTVGRTSTTKGSHTQVNATDPGYYVSSGGVLCRDEHRVNGVQQYQLDDSMATLAAWTTSGTAPTLVGGKAQCAVAPGAGGSGLVSVASYNVQGHEVSADLAAAAILHPTQSAYLRVRVDANNYAQAETFSQGSVPSLRLRIVKSGFPTTVSGGIPYDPTSGGNVTLREDGGNFYVGTRATADGTPSYGSGYSHALTKTQLSACKIEVGVNDPGPANLVPNGSFETDTSGWTGSGTGNSNVARSTAQFHGGTASMLVTASNAGDTGATSTAGSSPTTDAAPVTAGVPYTLSWWGRTVGATARQMSVRFYWYDTSGTYLGASSVDSTTVDNTTWTQATGTATAPTGAAYMSWRVYMRGLNAGEAFYVDDVTATYPGGTVTVDTVRAKWYASQSSLSMVNSSQPPALGNDGTNLLVGEYDATNNQYTVRTVDPGNLLTVSATVNLPPGSNNGALTSVLSGTFDFGAARYVTRSSVAANLTWAYDSTGAYQLANAFPNNAGSSGGGLAWDGTNFYGLSTGSRLYKHTTLTGTANPTTPWQAAFTWYDGDPTGGTHETTPSPRTTFTMSRRARLTVTSPDIPDLGGSDDPDRIAVYLANAANATLYQQTITAEGVKTATLTSATFSGTAAPTINNFPGATPGQIVSSDGTLVVKGDGTVQAASVRATAMHIGRYARITSGQSVAASTTTTVQLNSSLQLVGLTWDATNFRFTVTRAGRYLLIGQVTYAATAAASAGRVEASIYVNGAVTATGAAALTTAASQYPAARTDCVRDLAVGDTVSLVTVTTAALVTHFGGPFVFLEVVALY